MIQSDATSSSTANLVEGFSARFNLLMDRAQIPRENRVSYGAKRFRVVHNTFKSWCVANKIPGTHSMLTQIVEELLKEMPGRHNPKSVVAWLLAGDAVPNPFADDTDALAFVELYLQIADIARRERVDFDSLPREVRNKMLTHVLRHLRSAHTTQEAGTGLQLDEAAVSMVIGMLDTASLRHQVLSPR
jgi:hypothetical protein